MSTWRQLTSLSMGRQVVIGLLASCRLLSVHSYSISISLSLGSLTIFSFGGTGEPEIGLEILRYEWQPNGKRLWPQLRPSTSPTKGRTTNRLVPQLQTKSLLSRAEKGLTARRLFKKKELLVWLLLPHISLSSSSFSWAQKLFLIRARAQGEEEGAEKRSACRLLPFKRRPHRNSPMAAPSLSTFSILRAQEAKRRKPFGS